MRLRALFLVLATAPCAALAASGFTALHPEEALPDPTEQVAPDPYTGLIGRVQDKLRELGFAAGPSNGDFGAKTQAALAQFQLSRTIPASGQLDDDTLAELGVRRDQGEATAGASVPASPATEPALSGSAEDKREAPTAEKPGS
jgi:peptidoglycan hydrolase-like protein with peptidoglycan-binding domain